jgi:hypothetical protein
MLQIFSSFFLFKKINKNKKIKKEKKKTKGYWP